MAGGIGGDECRGELRSGRDRLDGDYGTGGLGAESGRGRKGFERGRGGKRQGLEGGGLLVRGLSGAGGGGHRTKDFGGGDFPHSGAGWVFRQDGDAGRLGRCQNDLGVGEGGEAGFHEFRDARKEGGGKGNDFGGGREQRDEKDVFLDGDEDGRGVEEGGGKGDADFAGFEGGRGEGVEAGEEDICDLGRLSGDVGGRGEDGRGGGEGNLTRRRRDAEGGRESGRDGGEGGSGDGRFKDYLDAGKGGEAGFEGLGKAGEEVGDGELGGGGQGYAERAGLGGE